MTTWELVRILFKNTNLYWRKFLVFFMLILVGSTGFFIWSKNSQTQASTNFEGLQQFQDYGNYEVKVEVMSNGKVFKDGKNVSDSLKIFPTHYELRLVVMNTPGEYVPFLITRVALPQKIKSDEVWQNMYAIHGVGNYDYAIEDSKTLLYTAQDIPSTGEVTIVAHLPLSLLEPSLSKRLTYGLSQISIGSYTKITLLLPFLTFIVLAGMVIRRRQDQFFYLSDKAADTPPDLTPPAIIGALVDGQLGSRELAATIIDLANRGYLFINRKGDSFVFGKRKSLNLEDMKELRPFEQLLLAKIFEPKKYKSTKDDVDMRVGKHIFSRKIAQSYLEIYNETFKAGYYVKNPASVHLVWKYAGIGLFFLSFLSFMLNAFYAPDPKFVLFVWVGGMIAASIIIKLSALMPIRSVTGTVTLRKWLEFRRYLHMNKTIEPMANYEGKFVEYLPYAIVFGVEADWARRFFSSSFRKPDWYESDESEVTLDSFIAGLFSIISYVGTVLDKAHEPTVD